MQQAAPTTTSSKATPRGKQKVQTTPMRIRDELEPRTKALSSSKKTSVTHLDQQLLVQLKSDIKFKAHPEPFKGCEDKRQQSESTFNLHMGARSHN